MKILFIGDIVGRPGRETVKKVLPEIKSEHNPDLIIANGENLTHGKGISTKTINEMRDAGINFFTSGNHVWRNKEGVANLNDKKFPVIRPANYPPTNVPGRGYEIIEDGMMNKVLVINLMGRVFITRDYDCPFRVLDQILEETKHEKFAAIFLDFHAEASSEKCAMGFFADGKVSAVIGTHTHIPTADLRVLENGTAYMTDAGMVGPLDSVIGVRKNIIINSFLTQLPTKHQLEHSGTMVFSSVLIDIDEKTSKALNAVHVQKFVKL